MIAQQATAKRRNGKSDRAEGTIEAHEAAATLLVLQEIADQRQAADAIRCQGKPFKDPNPKQPLPVCQQGDHQIRASQAGRPEYEQWLSPPQPIRAPAPPVLR